MGKPSPTCNILAHCKIWWRSPLYKRNKFFSTKHVLALVSIHGARGVGIGTPPAIWTLYNHSRELAAIVVKRSFCAQWSIGSKPEHYYYWSCIEGTCWTLSICNYYKMAVKIILMLSWNLKKKLKIFDFKYIIWFIYKTINTLNTNKYEYTTINKMINYTTIK